MTELTFATTRFMESLDLQHWTRIGTMNPFSFVAPVFQPARRADWKVGVTAARFMESLHSFCARIGTMNLRKVRAARQRAADVSSAEPSFFCRQDAGSTLRFMERVRLNAGGIDRFDLRFTCTIDFKEISAGQIMLISPLL